MTSYEFYIVCAGKWLVGSGVHPPPALPRGGGGVDKGGGGVRQPTFPWGQSIPFGEREIEIKQDRGGCTREIRASTECMGENNQAAIMWWWHSGEREDGEITSQRLLDQSQAGLYTWENATYPPILGLFFAYLTSRG